MRQGSNNGRRPRGRTNRKQHGGGGGGGQPRIHTFDSNGPDGRVRGNARQVYEKYLSLARDASSAGDRVAAEAYYQHAEHYFRILSDSTDPTPSGRRPDDRRPQAYGQDDGYYGSDEDADASVNGQAAQQRQYEPRNNSQPSPQPQRDSRPRDQGPHEATPRQSQAQAVSAESAAAPAAPEAPAQAPVPPPVPAEPAAGGDAQRPRRGRPRKPRPKDEEQALPQDSAPEPESGPVS